MLPKQSGYITRMMANNVDHVGRAHNKTTDTRGTPGGLAGPGVSIKNDKGDYMSALENKCKICGCDSGTEDFCPDCEERIEYLTQKAKSLKSRVKYIRPRLISTKRKWVG